jgi:hypothetical protein
MLYAILLNRFILTDLYNNAANLSLPSGIATVLGAVRVLCELHYWWRPQVVVGRWRWRRCLGDLMRSFQHAMRTFRTIGRLARLLNLRFHHTYTSASSEGLPPFPATMSKTLKCMRGLEHSLIIATPGAPVPAVVIQLLTRGTAEAPPRAPHRMSSNILRNRHPISSQYF